MCELTLCIFGVSLEEKRRISIKEQEEAVRSVVINPIAPVKGIKFIPFSFVWVDLIFLEIRASFISIVGTLRVLGSYEVWTSDMDLVRSLASKCPCFIQP